MMSEFVKIFKKIEIITCAILILLLTSLPLSAQNLPWEKLAKSVDFARVKVSESTLFSSELLLVKVDLSKYRPSIIHASNYGSKKMHVENLCKKSNATIGINTNFFDEKSRPLGLSLSKGNKKRNIHWGGNTLTGIFQYTSSKASIVHRKDFKFTGVLEATQAGPRLVVDGKKVAGIKRNDVYDRRAGLCTLNNNKIILFISNGFSGVTIKQLQDVLTSKGVSCRNALNLDGGGSAQLFISEDIPNKNKNFQGLSIFGRDSVPVILGLFPQVQTN